MKKMISVFLLLVMALSLASCRKSDTNADTNGGASTTVAEAQQGSSTSEQNESKPVSLGDFSAQDFDGNAVSKDIFTDYDLTMVNLWTTTCSYCIEEMPILNELRKEFQDDGVRFNIISVCMDVGNTNEINEDSLKKAKEIIPLENTYENDYLYTSFVKPVAYSMDGYYFLKFNLAYAAIHPLTQEEFLTKYPFLVVFHEKGELIEFRFDVLKRVFLSDKKEPTIYSNLIAEMSDYFKEHFECDLIPLNLDFMVNVCKRDENVKLIAQSMKLPNGGNAQLDVGNNQEYILPFIGELRSLLNDNQAELEKVPDFREALEQFMFEMEEMSDYPWIELLWENEIKTRSNRVKFVFNYMNKSYCLIQYYYSNVLIGMERMNYVIEYIVNHRNDDTTQNE